MSHHAVPPRPSHALVARAHHETAIIQDDPKPSIPRALPPPEGRSMPPPLQLVAATRRIVPRRLRRVSSPMAVLPTVDVAPSIVRCRRGGRRRRRDRSRTLCDIRRREEGYVGRRVASIFQRRRRRRRRSVGEKRRCCRGDEDRR